MLVGVFDQNDWSGRPTVDQYQERLSLIKLYEKCGFYCYHMSEHHGTPLSTTPSPSVFLAAVARETTTLRFGPLVYLLPGYNPLRLTEEIGMLDNLSQGRFEFGVGRGASPHEMGFLGVAAEDMQPMYEEALEIIRGGLINGALDHQGRYWRYSDIELSIRPVQRPHPPLWVAIGGSPASAEWAAANGANIIVGASAPQARIVFRHYLDRRRAAEGAKALLGLNRWVYVGETDEEALAVARRAWGVFYAHFIKLWRKHGGVPGNRLPEDFELMLESGNAIIGSADTVASRLSEQVCASGANFISCCFVFGDMTPQESRQSVQRFASDVLPRLEEVSRSAHAELTQAA